MPACYRPVLLVEGDGDQLAVPLLIRKVAHALGIYAFDPVPRPIKAGEIAKLSRAGELERFLAYGCIRPEADSVLLVLDCDDACPVDVVREFSRRITGIRPAPMKKIAIALIKREFESLYLASVASLAHAYPDYGWDLGDVEVGQPCETIRGAKAALNRLMKSKTYKETRDQPKFVQGLDLDALQRRSRSYRHLVKTLQWLASDEAAGIIYPVVL